MIARTFNGQTAIRTWLPPLSLAVTVASLVIVLVVGLGAGREAATAFEGEELTAGADTSEGSAHPAPLATMAPGTAEVPAVPDPPGTVPAILVPPTESPANDPSPTLIPTPTEPAIVAPTPSSDPTPPAVPTESAEPPSDLSGDAVRTAAESTAIEIDTCVLALESDDVVGQGEGAVYACSATITIVAVPSGFSEIVLDWGTTVDVTPGWTAELRRQSDAGNGSEDVWSPGATPGLGVVEHLGVSDDVDGNPADDVFVYEVHFDVRLTAPACGGPIEPDVAIAPSVLPVIDGIDGWRRHGELYRQIRSSLAVAAPAPVLSRTATGELDDAHNPLRFSHTDQTVDAGTWGLSVTSGYCGGWTVSISATDFWSDRGDAMFDAGSLWLTATGTGSGGPSPAGGALRLSNAAQSLVSAPYQPLPSDTYRYSFDLTLMIPGGTPPGTYTSTLTVTTSAAP